MNIILPALPLALLLLTAVPAGAIAQDPSPPIATSAGGQTVEESPSNANSPEEAAFNEKSSAMGQRVLYFDAELKETARLHAADPETARAALDSLQAQFQAEIDAFLEAFIAFAVWKEPSLTPEERDVQRRGVENMVPQLAAVPRSLRESAEAAARSPVEP